MSYADSQTDKRLEALEKKIKREYAKAYREMTEYYYNYIDGWDEIVNGKKVHHAGLEERYEKEYQAYMNGAYTDQEFRMWYITQLQRGERYNKMRSDMAQRITDANKVAAAYVNDTTPGIYSLNANYSAYQLEKHLGIAFDIVNENTVKRLMEGVNHTQFRVLRTNQARDYEWNYNQIQSALLSGILQGKSIGELTDAFLTVMKRNRTAAVRNARTAVTSAQNGGTYDTLNKASERGIELKKEWISTLDGRTRDSHRNLDGETVGTNEKFSNGLRYPGDPEGAGAEVYNCRCTIGGIIPGINDKKKERWARTSLDKNERGYEITDAKNYNEWLKRKTERNFDVDDFKSDAKRRGIDEAVQKIIADTFKEYENKGGMHYSEVYIAKMGTYVDDEGKVKASLFKTDVNAYGMTVLKINEDYFNGRTLEEINENIRGTDINVAQNLREAIIHECGHAKAYYGKRVDEIVKMNEELSKVRVAGISQIAYNDGAELIAEIEVLIARGDNVPSEALRIYEKYTRKRR